MQYWMKLLIFLALVTIVKAHGRFILLAIMGLVGMWFTHLLAQDYQSITRPVEAVRHLLGKRSIDHITNYNKHFSEITWETVLSNDPKDCVKSFLCQVSANSKNLNREERSILEMARNSKHNKILQYISEGQTASSIALCKKTYIRCPFAKETMIRLTA